jgi:zinc protease
VGARGLDGRGKWHHRRGAHARAPDVQGHRHAGAGRVLAPRGALGGRENAFTTRDYTGYYQQVPAGKLADTMALEADRFAHNRYSDAEFAKELEVVKEERRMRTDDSRARACSSSRWRPPSPPRPTAARWWAGWAIWTPCAPTTRAPSTSAGTCRPTPPWWWWATSIRPPCWRWRKDLRRHRRAPVPARKPQPEPPQPGERRIEVKAPAEQAVVSLAFKVPRLQGLEPSPDNDDALALTVLAAVLDGYSGARLDRNLAQGPTAWPIRPAPATG